MKTSKWVEPLSLNASENFIGEVWRKHLQTTKISRKMFQSELDWFEDQLPMTRAEYLAIDRRGRGFGLSEEMRQQMFELDGRVPEPT